MSQRVLIIGGKGSGTVIAQAINDANNRGSNDIIVEGFIHDRCKPGEIIDGTPVIAKQTKENIQLYWKKGYKFIFSLHRTDGGKAFLKLFSDLSLTPNMLATFVHPTAYVAPNVKIENGAVIMPYVMISSGATIRLNTLIMTGATIGHNTTTGKYSHIASQAVVGAYIKMGTGVHVGLNATVREYISMGDFSTLGMGGVLTKNIGEEEVWVGNPAKFLRKAKE